MMTLLTAFCLGLLAWYAYDWPAAMFVALAFVAGFLLATHFAPVDHDQDI